MIARSPTVLLALVLLLVVSLVSGCSCGKQSCSAGQSCPAGQVCGGDGFCGSATIAGFTVDARARGCEVLLTEQPGTEFSAATFGTGVVGTALRQAPSVAITFVAAADKAVGGDQVQLALTSGTAAGLTVTRASCVDVTGAKLPDVTVSLH
jgi:hypothetical protein